MKTSAIEYLRKELNVPSHLSIKEMDYKFTISKIIELMNGFKELKK